MQRPFISIALCTFNGARYLREQLESIANQSCAPSEVVVCDDGSTDGTIEILEEFAASCEFDFQILKNDERLGSTKNFAKAIQFCRGELIALCDQDDIWMPGKLATLRDAIEQHANFGYSFSDAELIDKEGRLLNKTFWQGAYCKRLLYSGFPPEKQGSILLKCNVVIGATMLFRSALKSRILPIADHWVHDYWIASVASLTGAYGIAVPRPLVFYRQHSNQQIGAARSIPSRLRNARDMSRAQWRPLVSSYEDLLKRVTACDSIAPQTLEEVTQKIRHVKARAACHKPRGSGKIKVMVSEVISGRYAKYSNSWNSVFQDLIF